MHSPLTQPLTQPCTQPCTQPFVPVINRGVAILYRQQLACVKPIHNTMPQRTMPLRRTMPHFPPESPKHSLEPLLARPHPVCMYCFLWISCCIHQLDRILVASRTGFSVPKFSLQAGISGGRALGVARFVQPGRAYDNRAGTATLAWRKLGNTSVTAWQ